MENPVEPGGGVPPKPGTGVRPDNGYRSDQQIGQAPLLLRPDPEDMQRRVRLWETTDNIHCSVIGTCASMSDIRRIAARVGLRIDPGLEDFAVHGLAVQESAQDTAFSRALHKVMDRRHEGANRLVARTRDERSLERLWFEKRDQGLIPGFYWALMTHGHVSRELRFRIFGDVHMLSHLSGVSTHAQMLEASRLQAMLEESEERARRIEGGLHDAIAARDAEIERLKRQNVDLRGELAASRQQAPATMLPQEARMARRLEKLQRALALTRVRARQAEQRCEALLAERQHRTEDGSDRSAARLPDKPAPMPTAATSQAVRSILYIGGRGGNVDRLRSIAAEFETDLICHDGGIDESVHRLDQMLPSVDCVLCPINCVSHDACLRAKRACQQLGKPFRPLRTASQTALRAALSEIVGPAADNGAGSNASDADA